MRATILGAARVIAAPERVYTICEPEEVRSEPIWLKTEAIFSARVTSVAVPAFIATITWSVSCVRT